MLVRLENVTKDYDDGNGTVRVLTDISRTIEPGCLETVTGPSGSGKSTLLQVLGGLTRPTSGRVLYGDRAVSELDDEELARFRRRNIGFVFQAFHLLPSLTALENVTLPLLLDDCSPGEARSRAETQLNRVGMARHAAKYPEQLAGGEQQRAAIARALVIDPVLVLADEPTGNLDLATTQTVLELLTRAVEGGTTVVMATHDPAAAALGKPRLTLADGALG